MAERINISDKATWPEWLTAKQVAEILQCNVNMVRSMVESGELRAREFGPRTLRITKESVTAQP